MLLIVLFFGRRVWRVRGYVFRGACLGMLLFVVCCWLVGGIESMVIVLFVGLLVMCGGMGRSLWLLAVAALSLRGIIATLTKMIEGRLNSLH